MKFEDVPRLSKLPFILGDIALLLLAGLIATRHPHPFSQPLPLLIITGCFFVGIVAAMIPFIVNNARDQEEAAAALRRELGEQFKRLMAASEHLQHATAQLKTVEEIATKNLQAAEKLPYRLQEKIAEFNQQLAETENEEKEALEQELAVLRSTESERLAATADKIAKTTAEWTKLEAGCAQAARGRRPAGTEAGRRAGRHRGEDRRARCRPAGRKSAAHRRRSRSQSLKPSRRPSFPREAPAPVEPAAASPAPVEPSAPAGHNCCARPGSARRSAQASPQTARPEKTQDRGARRPKRPRLRPSRPRAT